MILFLISCASSLSPDQIQSPSDVPMDLKQKHCPEDHLIMQKGTTAFCSDPNTGNKNGPQLVKDGHLRALYFFEQGSLNSFPWFVTEDNAIDTEWATWFSEKELPAEALSDYLTRFPAAKNKKDIVARLIESGQRPLDDLISVNAKPCEQESGNLLCVSGGGGVAKLKTRQSDIPEEKGAFSFYQVYQTPTFYIDPEAVVKEDVEKCQQKCLCPQGDWSSLPVAKAYCESLNKRLPTAAEMLLYYKQFQPDVSLMSDLTSTQFAADRRALKVYHNMPPQCDECAENDKIIQFYSQQHYRYSSTKNVQFRCVTSSLSPDYAEDYPLLLLEKPEIEERDFSFAGRSWAAKDKMYQAHVKQGVSNKAFDYGYKNIYMVRDLLWQYHLDNPEITRLYQLGKTRENLPILALRITKNPAKDEIEPAILINGAHHGDELMSVLFPMYNIHDTLENKDAQQIKHWIDNIDIWFVPLVNPDGNWMTLHRNSGKNIGRKNGRDTHGECHFRGHKEGVDLNRNYPFYWNQVAKGSSGDPLSDYYRGDTSGSEPETKALMRLANKYRFVGAISWHTNGTMIISPYTIPGPRNPDPDLPWQIAEELVKSTPIQPNKRKMVVKSSMYAVDGTDQDWHYHTHGTIAYIIEGSHHNPKSTKIRSESVQSLHPIYTNFVERIAKGPAVYGRIVDAQDNPVTAEVVIDGVQLNNNEKWTSRPKDGLFYRLLPREGTYKIEIVADGFKSFQHTFTSTLNGPSSVGDITLSRK